MSRSWASGSTRAWRKTRARVLAANLLNPDSPGACRIALPGTWRTSDGALRWCAGVADCVHHTRGKRYGDNPADLVAACTPCNLKVGDPTRSADPIGKAATRWEL